MQSIVSVGTVTTGASLTSSTVITKVADSSVAAPAGGEPESPASTVSVNPPMPEKPVSGSYVIAAMASLTASKEPVSVTVPSAANTTVTPAGRSPSEMVPLIGVIETLISSSPPMLDDAIETPSIVTDAAPSATSAGGSTMSRKPVVSTGLITRKTESEMVRPLPVDDAEPWSETRMLIESEPTKPGELV